MNSSEKVTQSRTVRARVWIYIVLTLGLSGSYFLLRGFQWQGTANLHTAMEIVSTTLAFVVGTIALKRYKTTRESVYLFLGTAFIGTGFLDGYHALVTSAWVKDYLPSDLPALIPWSWVASRLFLAFMLFIGVLFEYREKKMGLAGQIDPGVVYASAAVMTIGIFLFFAFVPLPRAYYPELFFHRPEELVPAVFFVLALFFNLRKGRWRDNAFEHWMIVCLIVNVVGQSVFMSFSGRLFDFEFDVAHSLKKVSYICALIGLCVTMGIQSRDKLNAWRIYNDGLKAEVGFVSHHFLGFGRKISLLVVSCVILSFATTGVIVQLGFNQALKEREYQKLQRDVTWLDHKLIDEVKRLGQDAVYLSTIVSGRSVALGKSSEALEGQTVRYGRSELFEIVATEKLEHDLSYDWAGYINFEDETQKLAKVERAGETIQFRESNGLDLGDYGVFLDSARDLPPSRVVFTDPIETQENALLMHAFVSVVDENNKPKGVVVVQKNIEKAIGLIHEANTIDSELYVTTATGEYLVNSDFEEVGQLGKGELKNRIQDDFPSLGRFFSSIEESFFEVKEEKGSVHYLFVGEKINYSPVNPELYFVLFAANPYRNVLASVADLLKQVLFGGLLIMLATIVLALVFANTITGPLAYIARSISSFGKGKRITDLPVNLKDEIGVLARAFEGMSEEVVDREVRLEEEVSTRRLAEMSLRFKNDEMEQLMYTVSHDLKSPIVTIRGFAGMLEESIEEGDSEGSKDSLVRIRKAAKHMSALINDILELSRIGRVDTTVEVIDMDRTLVSVGEFVQGALDSAKAKLVVEPNLPSVSANKQRVIQIFQNLIANAIKYGCPEEGSEVRVGAQITDTEYRFFVKDQGPGIDPKYHDKIFILFQRLESEEEGTGLGLAIVSKTIRLYGGRVWLDSEKGAGCTFWLSFPVKPESNS